MKKRLLAMIMTLAMCLSLLPVSALATGDTSSEPPDDSGNKTITVDDSFTDEDLEDLTEGSTYATIQAAIDFIATKEDKTDWTITVNAGEYDRFTVLSELNGLTVQAAEGATVTINTANNSTAPATTNGGFPDTAGVSIRDADHVTLTGLTFNVGTQDSPWYSAAVSNYSESSTKGDNLTVKNCAFNGSGSGIGVFINTGTTKFHVVDCTFDGLKEAISMYGDGTLMVEAKVTGNTMTNCAFAIHGYYGGTGEAGVLTFANNTVTGTDALRNKIVIQDQTNTGALKADVKDNTLTNAIVGLVNLREEGETVSDVLNSNSFDDGSFYVEAVEPGTINFYTTYQAPESDDGYWVLTELNDTDWTDEQKTYVEDAVKNANADGAKSLSITGIPEGDLIKTFTWFKDGIYWVSEETETPEEPEEPSTPSTTLDWDVSKSKEATNLDNSFESTVTLSLPAAEDELVTDVVFVFDESSCNELGAVQEEVLSMLKELYGQFSETDAKIKVGAVQFRGNVTKLPLTELNDESIGRIQTFMKTRPTVGGSNMSAGLLAGEKMLDSDTSVSADRKYLILVSDGITYIWDDEATEEQENYGVNFANCDTPNSPMLASPDGWDVKYGTNQYYVPEDWSDHLENVYHLLNKTIEEKASLYERGENATIDKPFIAGNERDQYTSTVDIALYKSYEAFQSISAKYHTYVRNVGVESEMATFPFGPSFMTYLAGGKDLTFEDIQKEIYYVVSTGSYVVDTMGYGNDGEGNWYEFDFVDDIDTLELTVGEESLNKFKLSEDDDLTVYGFGAISLPENARANNKNYQFVLEYHHEKDDDYEDYFILHINTDITITNPVQLTYKVVLTNPQTSAGTYGTYDEDGSQKLNDLWTNRSATLYPVDSEGNPGTAEDFLKPTVSYTVESSGGGGGGGGNSKPPVLNTEDHFGYIIGYPEHYLTGEACHDQTLMPVKPEGNITRAEVATIFFRMLTDESRNEFWSQTSSYSDVELDDWFNNAICTLSNAGLINGYEDGSFKPNGKITRAEFATIASRFFEYADENMENPFSDVEEDTWYYRYIMAASDMGLINGYPDGTFKPDNLITRAEAVTIVNRTLDRHPDQEHFLEDMLVWPDNMDTEKWYYEDMQEATNSHEYQMKTKNGEKYEVWTKMLPIRDWEAFEKAWSDANSSNNPGEVVK